ncbi:MAG: DUF1365 domain-containing protein [Nitratireductor sp.]|nr:DUF1365 domain-containing protein [Nitratireductor sp.]
MMFERPAIMQGSVVHQRIQPVRHRLEYGVFSILTDLEEIDGLKKRRLFGTNRFNLLSFHARDMADGESTDLAGYVRRKVHAETGISGISHVWLLTFPRVLGHVFNPLSIYFCLNSNHAVVAAVFEVSNTFGDRTSYVCAVNDGRVESASKRMLVSPFNKTMGRYRFSLHVSDDELTVGVALYENGHAILRTHQKLKALPFTDAQILKSTARYPFMTLKVVAAIHFEAARLWLKGLRFPQKVSRARKTQHMPASSKQ